MVAECPLCGLRTSPYNVRLHVERGCPTSAPSQRLQSSPSRPFHSAATVNSQFGSNLSSKTAGKGDHKSAERQSSKEAPSVGSQPRSLTHGERNILASHSNNAEGKESNATSMKEINTYGHNSSGSGRISEQAANAKAKTEAGTPLFDDKKNSTNNHGQYVFNTRSRELTSSSPPTEVRKTTNLASQAPVGNALNTTPKRSSDETYTAATKRRNTNSASLSSNKPLAERCRPKSLDDFVGQEHLVGSNGILQSLLYSGSVPSMILWGPSGVGKTTFARILARECKAQFEELSAPQASTNDIKRVIEEARNLWKSFKKRTVLFLDEIHRFNRAQQDSLLAAVENGDIVLVGATTENPSFKLNGALLSRTRVFILQSLNEEAIRKILDRALSILGLDLDAEIKKLISQAASGDGRIALNMLELVLSLPEPRVMSQVKEAIRATMVYDQKGDFHYDNISAFHKSVRGSDANAAMYYLARMLEGGEDPLYVARRMVRIASEDVGVADETCLPFAIAALQAAQNIGMPESDVILAHCAVKLARAPKSVEVYKAYGRLKADLANEPQLAGAAIPMHLRNAPTKLMKDSGYGANYKYNPDYDGPVDQEYMPSEYTNRKWLRD